MHRPVRALLIGLLVASGCNEVDNELTDPEGRPLELTYITATIFAPSCGQAQCHSKFHQAGGLVFDNPDDARASLHTPGDELNLLRFDSEQNDFEWRGLNDTEHYYPNLIVWLTQTDPFNQNMGRMPSDAPLARRDIELLVSWIRDPELYGTGGKARGAQCDPDHFDGLACNGDLLYTCRPDGNFGEVVDSCSQCKLVDADRAPVCN